MEDAQDMKDQLIVRIAELRTGSDSLLDMVSGGKGNPSAADVEILMSYQINQAKMDELLTFYNKYFDTPNLTEIQQQTEANLSELSKAMGDRLRELYEIWYKGSIK